MQIGRLAAVATLVALLVPAIHGQDATAAAPAAPDQRVVASVNGQPITSSDVAYHVTLIRGNAPPDVDFEQGIVQRIAEQILLAAEAQRLGLDMTDSQVDAYWRQRFGTVPDYKKNAHQAGTTVGQQRLLAKRVALSEIYLLHKVDLRFDPGVRIDPDLALSRLVQVTPAQLREYYHEFKEQLDHPPSVTYEVYPCAGREAAEAVAATLEAGDQPSNERAVKESAALGDLELLFPYAPKVAAFLRDGVVGAVSEPNAVPDHDTVLVLRVVERTEAKEAVFEEVQDELRNRIQGSLIVQARQTLVAQLARGAVFWPSDLFPDVVARLR